MANPILPYPTGTNIPTVTGNPSLFAGGSLSNYNQQYGAPNYQSATNNTPSSSPIGGANILSKIPTDKLSGVTNAVNNWGAANVGTALPKGAPIFNGVGPSNVVQPTSMLGPTTLSNVAGGAGVGGIVAGLTGGNQIAGSVGGAAGMVLGNMILPGIGGWIGSAVLGGIGGKLFGKAKPSNKLQVGAVNLGDGGFNPEGDNAVSQGGKKFDANNAKFRDSIRDASSATSQFLLKSGAKPIDPDGRILVGIGSRDGMWYSADNAKKNNWEANKVDTKDAGQLTSGVFDTLMKQYNITDPAMINKAAQVYATKLGVAPSQVAQGQPQGSPLMIPTNKGDKNTFQTFLQKYKGDKPQPQTHIQPAGTQKKVVA